MLARYLLALLCLALAACGPTRSRASSDLASPEAARAAELGRGVGRDYAEAARIHALRCADGTGDPMACRRLAFAYGRGRGVAVDGDKAQRLTAMTCLRVDVTSCGVPPGVVDREARIRAIEQACERGNGDACLFMLGYGDGGAAEERRAKLRNRICRAGEIEGCTLIAKVTWGACGSRNDACVASTFALARELRSSKALYAELEERRCHPGGSDPRCDALASLSESDPVDDLVFALDRLDAWCRDGDADACEKLPGRAIAPAVLCAAADYQACAVAGTVGDRAAAVRACDHDVAEGCYAAAHHAAGDSPADPRRAHELLARACILGSRDACVEQRLAD